MFTKLVSLLATYTTLAAATSFQLRSYAPKEPKLHNFWVNAGEQRFWVNLSRPDTYCPDFSGASCPPGNTTVVDGRFSQLKTLMSKGQRVYLDPYGVISYTVGDDASAASMPEGSNFNCFRAVTIKAADSSQEIQILRFINLDDVSKADQSFFFACPQQGREHHFLRVRWTSQHNNRDWHLDWDSQCTPLEGLMLVESDVEIGAHQYV
ncbi:hypothetical protein CORC01_07173 [Colletotrichum orchidophilum]|uniref:Uncharacterized protein n=1 Tax=Colletotrichum orchidophilum TaxID=1209926 RepID=A0A1G4B7Y1_9PEZI|nr:uncharacterized protein CORC01_07173 [Colletotrichum orchidophilum]OHE97558.1 hypothetical protein CORC01_07173 [Colletotrichum orchidophilum]